jgi:hypothetical protein
MFLPIKKITSFRYKSNTQVLTLCFGCPTTSIVDFFDFPKEEFEKFKNSENQQDFYLEKIRGQYHYKTFL